VSFRMESGGIFIVVNVLWVPELWRVVLLVSTIKNNGFDVLFQDGHAFFKKRGSRLETTFVLKVRERDMYKIKGYPLRSVESGIMEEKKW
jgi:prepilin-type processing-associated H-X9-DG protein